MMFSTVPHRELTQVDQDQGGKKVFTIIVFCLNGTFKVYFPLFYSFSPTLKEKCAVVFCYSFHAQCNLQVESSTAKIQFCKVASYQRQSRHNILSLNINSCSVIQYNPNQVKSRKKELSDLDCLLRLSLVGLRASLGQVYIVTKIV